MRLFAALLILTLGGCGIAVSDKPMLAAADTIGAPQFEDGVWLLPELDEEEDCAVDTAQPVSKWPDCASWSVHRDGQWFARDGDSGIATKAVPYSTVTVSNGDIAIIQLESDKSPADDGTVDPMPYSFGAFDNKPAATAKLRSIRFWIVMCGKYEESGADDDAPMTLIRYPGFDEKCRPASMQVLRDAAAASRPPPTLELPVFHWVRATLD
ncbi:MAG TPA: hypothetical protein PKD48_12705 [Sphingopyxis sp.]|nr:hypothetical protein [Sphingopyxis sp.]HMQ20698.1 hypothetical protein [Sphingopyxis sp.]